MQRLVYPITLSRLGMSRAAFFSLTSEAGAPASGVPGRYRRALDIPTTRSNGPGTA